LAKGHIADLSPTQLQMDSSDLDPNEYMVPWINKSQPPNIISIGSDVYARHIRVNNTETRRHTHRQTDRP